MNKDSKRQGATMEEPEELTLQFLREITDGFSEKREVGKGGFGTVYKGVTKTGEDVAVKILRDGGKDLDYRQFRNEYYNLMKVKHANIVQFLGYCFEIEPIRREYNGRTVLAEKTHTALCFEFVHNGSLQKHLSDESCGLDWHTRYKIIKGTCEGLKYLHKDLGESLLHLDLKPDNILLDKNMVPKIADFGLSKIFCDGLIRTTQSPLGTLGYQPPEYIDRGKISEKFDIFSLGAIIIKIVSGPNGYSKYLGMPVEFIDQVQRNWRERWQACSNDFLYEAWFRQVETCTQIALNCLDDDSQKRPDIVEIINMLNEIEIDNDEVLDFQAPKERTITVCEITMHNEMKPTKEHKVMTDHHQHSNLIISSRSSEIESDRTQGSLLDVGKELIVGREENKKTMASFLASMSENIIIFPVYGIGGIGKTTFARLIYNDANFKYYSQVWVYVSPGFDLFKIGNSIISQLSGKENHANEIQQIKSYLAKLISGKNILIVLDDLWENNTIRLVDLKDILSPGDSRKIIVLVTTRSQDIAKKICSNIEPYKIEALTDEMCWDIIKQKSGFDARHDNKKLVDIGKDIARKCGGVALAAQTLGSMLQSMKYDEWMKVKDSDIWNETISRDASLPNHVLASLKLSYVSMDDYLKSCFTYCAIFPKGHMIVKDDLFYQWISLGFIKPTLLFSTLQLCDKYIMRLLGMTFLQHSVSPTSYQAYGEHGTVFTMHDLVHDLAISLLDDQILDQRKQVNTGVSCCRYALLTDCSKPLESCMTSPAKLTALHFLDCWVTELHAAAFELYESLRVLDLSHCLIHKLPDSIGRLKQLRYLNAPRIRDRMVPECITKLSKLRYISLRGSCSILALPESIGEMEGLVHLDLSGCLRIEKLPESFGNLKSLEHLDFAGCKNATGVSQCLARLTKLQHLNLSNCKNIGDLPRAFGSLTELQYLNLSDSSYISGYKLAEADFLCFLTKLKYLNLSSSSFHMNLSSGKERRIISSPEVLGSLTELKYLNLSHHYIWGKLPESFGNLCNLVHLDLSYCHPLQGLPAALNGITKLQFLDLYQCSGFDTMEGLQDALGNLSELRHLNLGCCIGRISYYHPDRIDGLLGCICTLTNLEYLSLRENNTIYCIPETIAKLRKLHTLDLSSCGSLQRLPATIYEIKSLKYIYTTECWKLDRSILPHYTSTSRIPPLFVGYTGGGESSSYLFQIEARNPARLKISRLENVKSAKEAYTIKLVQKTEITQLELEWTRGAKRFVDDEEVLRELEAPYGVSEFRLQGYNSASFPSWVMHCDAYLPDLTRIDMWNLPSCNNLPPLGQLPNLKLLNIRRLDSIKKIDADLYGGTTAFPRLEEFFIDDMEWLEVWNTADSMFPCLRCVEIRDCPRLSFEPEVPDSEPRMFFQKKEPRMSSSWSNVLWSCCRGGASLSRDLNVECCVENCSDLTCSSSDFLRGLTSLEILTVENCESFTSLPSLGNLVSLTELHIGNCKNIWTLPDSIQELFGLKRLVIIECPELNHWCQYNEMKIAHVRHRNYYDSMDEYWLETSLKSGRIVAPLDKAPWTE